MSRTEQRENPESCQWDVTKNCLSETVDRGGGLWELFALKQESKKERKPQAMLYEGLERESASWVPSDSTPKGARTQWRGSSFRRAAKPFPAQTRQCERAFQVVGREGAKHS